jgi:hypothetical protein
MKARRVRQVASALGWLSLLGIVLALMALQDIYHGEPDLAWEWSILRISFLLITFHGFALVALRKSQAESDNATRSPRGQAPARVDR